MSLTWHGRSPEGTRGSESEDGHVAIARVLEAALGQPVLEGNAAAILRNGNRIFPSLWEAISSATHTVDVCCFEVDGGRIPERLTELLVARAEAGVRVRVLFDPIGGRKYRKEWVEAIRGAGGVFEWHDSHHRGRIGLQNFRFHRRSVVIDDRIGFAGGFGFADRWSGDARGPDEYRNYAIRVEGPVVEGLRAAFIEGWAANEHPVVDDHDTFEPPPPAGERRAMCVRASAGPVWNDAGTLYDLLLRRSTHRVRMGMGYFSPPRRMVRLLVETAQRGVQVQLLVPGPIMRRRVVKWAGEAAFDELLAGGVELHRYQPARLHGKYVTVDGDVCVIGSINLDDRSLSLDAEAGIVMLDRELTAQVDDDFDQDLRDSEHVQLGQWRHLGLLEQARDRLAHTINAYI